jgi:soluble lytic murein transglycosylase-like protein
VSPSSSSFQPTGSIRAGFEAAARAHEAARSGGGDAARQIRAPIPDSPVEAALARAAEATTVDFGYLLAQAEVESSMNPEARAGTSSATGLYQFIDSTWMRMVKTYGAKYGMGNFANAIDDNLDVSPLALADLAGAALVSKAMLTAVRIASGPGYSHGPIAARNASQ